MTNSEDIGIWKNIKDTQGYEISNLGGIRLKLQDGKFKYYYQGKNLYHTIKFIGKDQHNYFVHRLVAIHFIPNKDKKRTIVNHINGNKRDNRVENLEWITKGDDIRHAFRIGVKKSIKGRPNVKLFKKVKMYSLDGKFIKDFPSAGVASKELGISRCTISDCASGVTKKTGGYVWKY